MAFLIGLQLVEINLDYMMDNIKSYNLVFFSDFYCEILGIDMYPKITHDWVMEEVSQSSKFLLA